jgi:uncharacterized membrane protein SpoIIM required for sporulation
MVLESIMNPTSAKKRPWELFFIGLLYSTVALFLSYWVFREYSSLIMVFLVTLASAPLMYFTIISEERVDVKYLRQITILKEHSKVFIFLIYLFIGMTVGMIILYVFLPFEMVEQIFSAQVQTITNINNHISGTIISSDVFLRIFLNNIRVLVFSILFSLLYGVGAIFILTWNASVIAAAVGNFIRGHLASYASSVGLEKLGGYMHIFSLGFLRYAIHGIPEVLAYFIGGLAGGILSAAFIRHDFVGKRKERILFDTSEMILLATGILLVAAFIEVYITPIFF